MAPLFYPTGSVFFKQEGARERVFTRHGKRRRVVRSAFEEAREKAGFGSDV